MRVEQDWRTNEYPNEPLLVSDPRSNPSSALTVSLRQQIEQ